ncbi:MAG: hypothetical protein PVI57_15275, partial [Gemmatimonadota bacterium]
MKAGRREAGARRGPADRKGPEEASTAPGSSMAVVVASFRTLPLLEACLDSLEVARSRVDAPVVVARAGDGADAEAVTEGRPGVAVVAAGPDAEVPRLRGVGIAAAPAVSWIAVTEDHCLADPAWLERLRDATGPDVDVVGGGMGNARPGAVEWAAYFSEYGFFASGRADAGDPPLLTGANVAYSGRVASEVARQALAGDWENTIHRRLHEAGAKLRWEPRARVLQNGTYGVGGFCRDRFEHGRDYARTRLAGEAGAPR